MTNVELVIWVLLFSSLKDLDKAIFMLNLMEDLEDLTAHGNIDGLFGGMSLG